MVALSGQRHSMSPAVSSHPDSSATHVLCVRGDRLIENLGSTPPAGDPHGPRP